MRRSSALADGRQRGSTLLEALIAVLVLSLGMLALARLQPQMRLNAELARQRSEAVRLAQEDLESMRAYAALAATPGLRSFEGVASESRTVGASDELPTNTRFMITRTIDATATPRAKNALVTVSWTDRSGSPQQVALGSIIAGNDPALSGALGLTRSANPTQGPFGRSVYIPPAAKDLGDGRSAFKPSDDAAFAFVFDNGSGLLVARCAVANAATPTPELTAADLDSCDATAGFLLSGTVRFSSASPPDAAWSNDVPAAFSISMTMEGGRYPAAPTCGVQPVRTASGDRFATYHCAVYPSSTGQWSGRVTLLPQGWTIGTGPRDRRVCRYSADLDGSGAIDANIEHPASYANVDANLPNQNFLVIGGSETCPSGHAGRVAGNNGEVFVDLGTAQHQP